MYHSPRRAMKRIVPTFEQAARQVHASHAETFRNEKHKDQWINTLVQHVFPTFGDRRVDSVEPSDVLKALSAIWLATPETARRVRQRIKAVFDWAKAAGYRSGDQPGRIDFKGTSQTASRGRTPRRTRIRSGACLHPVFNSTGRVGWPTESGTPMSGSARLRRGARTS